MATHASVRKARLAPLDECLKLCELLPRLAFRGDVTQLDAILSWVDRENGQCAVVEVLASTDGAGRTPLLSAVRGQQLAAAAAILRRGADASQPMIDERRDTPLHVACRRNHGAMIELLLECGANAHAVNAEGQSPSDLVVVGATCGSAAFRRARHALRERVHMSAKQSTTTAGCRASADHCETGINLDAAGEVLGITDAQALRLIQSQLHAAVRAAPSFPLHPACELPAQLREVALQYAHKAADTSIHMEGTVADITATGAVKAGPNGWDWDHCTLQRIQSTYSTREHSLIWLDDKFEQVAQTTRLIRETSVASSSMRFDEIINDALMHLPFLLVCSRADILAVIRQKGDPAGAEGQNKDPDRNHSQEQSQEADQKLNQGQKQKQQQDCVLEQELQMTQKVPPGMAMQSDCKHTTELLKKLRYFVESDTPIAVKPRHGANGHGITTFPSPRSAGLNVVISACQAAVEIDNARLGENWQLARVPRGVLIQPLYSGLDRSCTAPLELKVQTIFGVVIGATLHTHPWQFWVFGGSGGKKGIGGGALHAWCDHGGADYGRGAKGAPRKWKKMYGAELPAHAAETLFRVLQTDWHHIAAVSARLARNAGLDELRVDWLVGDDKWGSRIGELTYIGGAERLIPALSKPFGHAFLVAHGSRLSEALR